MAVYSGSSESDLGPHAVLRITMGEKHLPCIVTSGLYEMLHIDPELLLSGVEIGL